MPDEHGLRRHLWAGVVYLAAIAGCAALMVAGGLVAGHESAFGLWKVLGVVAPIGCIGVALWVGGSVVQHRLRDPGPVAWLMLALAFVAVLPGIGVAAFLAPWYQSRHGRASAAAVVERRCRPTDSGGCAVEIRLTDASTGRDLGWFAGCDPIDRGQRVTVHGSRSGWLAPVVGECAGAAVRLFPVAAGTTGGLAAAVLLTRIGSSARRLRSLRGQR
ncbi:MAG: hypothetical protein J2P15_01090 [Micromonosporaceae bacterium]|nr:hypothetical protein [Micromonosporaceae bacterium]